MSAPRPRHARVPRAHLAVVSVVALVFALWRVVAEGGLTDVLEQRLLDLRFQLRGPLAPPASVAVVAIDEATVDALGWAPPPRRALAEAVRRLVEADAAVIALDLMFLDRTAAGPLLAEALAQTDRAVLATALTNRPAGDAERPPELEAALERSVVGTVIARAAEPAPGHPAMPPLDLLLPRPEFAGRATLAHVNIVQTADRVARRVPLTLWIGDDDFLPSMSLEAARRLAGLERAQVAVAPGRSVRLGRRLIPTDRSGSVTLNHYGPRGTVPTVSLADLLEGRAPADMFRGRAVFVGASAETLSDLFATPFAADVPGAELLATATANIAAGETVVEAPALHALGAVLAVVSAMLLFQAANLAALGAAFAAVPAVWLAALAAVHLAFAEWRFALDATAVAGALAFATSWTVAQRFRAQRRLATALGEERARLSRYVSPLLAERLAAGAMPERRSQDAGVLFVDVAGFTTVAESAAPEATAAFLAELHRLYERCATAHDGVISGFDGDGAMVMFGLPEPTRADAARALACGRMLLDEAARFASAALPALRLALRVSVHFGPVTAAVVGGERQAQLTVTGDTVNVASRLQEIAKQHGAAFVASRPALDAARTGGSADVAAFVPLADQPVRGRAGRIEVWALPAAPG
ncbi:MAG TPA: adenylate/guanylate cyclase domain-containing protein [Thermohalobaculum sp.]|nr:adenylate/guanylate cyclase domain-containing protein [Thermohalobaculum sp.]